LALSYDSSRKESLLTANFRISIIADERSDIFIPINPFGVSMVDTATKNSFTVSSGRTVTTMVSGVLEKTTIDGAAHYVIPAGDTAHFNVTSTAKPGELFAGTYAARIFGYWMPQYGQVLKVNPAENATNKVTVIGEVSPYITSVTNPIKVGEFMVIKGLRLSTNDNVYIDDSAVMIKASRGDGQTNINFKLPELSVGYHKLQISNKNGMSNIVGFDVVGGGNVFEPGCPLILTRDLTTGSTGTDVAALQNFLGVTPASGYFGAVLKAAVKAFQTANGISPANGFVGPATRAFIAKIDICVPPVVQPSITLMSPYGEKIFYQSNNQSKPFDNRISWISNGDFSDIQIFLASSKCNLDNCSIIGEIWRGTSPDNSIGWDGLTVCKDFEKASGNECSHILPGEYKVYIIGNLKNSSFVRDIPNYPFKIISATTTKPSITVLSSNGGETFTRGNSFTTGDFLPYKFEVKGVTSSGITKLELVSDDGKYYWIVSTNWNPNVSILDSGSVQLNNSFPAGKYVLSAKWIGDDGISLQDKSDSYFKIVSATTTQPSITVLSPNGGETIEIGQKYNITWNTKNTNNITVVLINDSIQCRTGIVGCQNSFTIYSGSNTGSYLWDTNKKMSGGSTGPNSVSVVPGSQYKIGIYATGESGMGDISDSYFKIVSKPVTPTPSITVLSPNGGESYKEGDTVTIKWNSQGLLPTQKLQITLDVAAHQNSTVGTTIAENIPNTGSYSWKVKTLQPFYESEGNSTIYPNGQYKITVLCPITDPNWSNGQISSLVS
jgi:hypothetical protein